MEEFTNIESNGGEADATVGAHGMALGGHDAELRVEVLESPDHEPKHIHIKQHVTMLEVMDDAARKLGVKLLPNPHAPLRPAAWRL